MSVKEVFAECQNFASSTKLLTKNLHELHLNSIKNGDATFSAEFFRCLDRILVLPRRDQCASRIEKFVANYVSEICPEDGEDDEDMIVFAESIVRRYLMGFNAAKAPVRQRCLKLVEIIMPLVPIEEELLDEIVLLSLKRLRDTNARVRASALLILARFDPTNDIITELTNTLFHDPSAELRLLAAFNVVKTSTESAENVVTRVRDDAVAVRRALFTKVLPNIDCKILKISTRELIVISGLKDSDLDVRKAAQKLVAYTWVSQCENSIANVIQRLDVLTNIEAAELVLAAFFKLRQDVLCSLNFDDEFFADLLPEDCVLLKQTVLEGLKNESLDHLFPDLNLVLDKIDQLQPSSVAECDLRPDERLFMTEMLLEIVVLSDFTDSALRNRVENLVTKLQIHELPPPAIKHLVALYRKLDNTDTSLISLVFEAQLQTSHDEVLDLVKGLTMLNCVLPNMTDFDIEPYVQSMQEGYIEPALASPVAQVAELGLQCLGQICLLSKRIASLEYPKLVERVVNVDGELSDLNKCELKVVVDLLLTHILPTDDLMPLLLSKQVCTTTELARLTLSGVVYSADILLFLINEYFTADDPYLQQVLGLFLYAFKESTRSLDLVTVYPLAREEISLKQLKQFVAQYAEFIKHPNEEFMDYVVRDIYEIRDSGTVKSLRTTLLNYYTVEDIDARIRELGLSNERGEAREPDQEPVPENAEPENAEQEPQHTEVDPQPAEVEPTDVNVEM